jgi:hypothetical protein
VDPDKVTLGANVTLADGAVGVFLAIAGDDETRTGPATAPVRVRLQEGQTIHVGCEQIIDAGS